MTARFLLFPALALSVVLAGCNQAAPPQASVAAAPADTNSGITPASFHMPEGAGCSGDVARWQAIQDNDLKTGHVTPSVYNQIRGDIERASAACQGGRDGEARSIVRASRSRHGYPGG